MKNKFSKPTKNNERGASLVEYALLVALIALIAMPSLGGISNGITRKLTHAKDGFEPTYDAGSCDGDNPPPSCF